MRKQILSITAILASVFVFLVGNGLLGTIIPVRASLEGFSGLVIGLIGSAYFVGFVAGCYAGPQLLARVGHSRTFAVAAGLATAATLLQSIEVSEIAWIVLRAVFGLAAACLYMVIESWLNDRATSETRGRIFSAYLTVNFVGLIAGQWLFSTARPSSFSLFVLSAVFYSLCLVPIGLTRLPQPASVDVPALRPLRMFTLSPVGVAGCIAVGLANSAIWTFAPVYAQDHGLTKGMLAAFMCIFTLGGAAIQVPIGRLSDRKDRRLIIAGIAMSAAALGVLIFFFGAISKLSLLLFIGAFGMAALPLYGMSVAHANDRLPREMFVEASATLLLINAGASTIGPVLAGFVIARTGSDALFLYSASIHVLLLVFVLIRIATTKPAALETRDIFEPMPQMASPASLELDPRGPETHGIPTAA